AIANREGISYLRTTRPKTPVLYEPDTEFEIGGSKVLRRSDRDQATIVAAGITLHEALHAYAALLEEGVRGRLSEAASVRPMGGATDGEAARESGRMVVVADHYWDGGVDDAVLDALGGRAEVHKLAVREVPRCGAPDELIAGFGIGREA